MAKDTLIKRRDIIVSIIIINILAITLLYSLKSGNIFNNNTNIQLPNSSWSPLMQDKPLWGQKLAQTVK